jgi:hypothetical protein
MGQVAAVQDRETTLTLCQGKPWCDANARATISASWLLSRVFSSVPREAHASTISLVVPTDTKKGAFTLQIWPAPNESLTFLLQPKPINLSKGGQQ